MNVDVDFRSSYQLESQSRAPSQKEKIWKYPEVGNMNQKQHGKGSSKSSAHMSMFQKKKSAHRS